MRSRRRGAAPVRRILRQYISITHKKKNKSFQVAERPDYSRRGNNKEESANEPGTVTFRKENVWGRTMTLNSRVIKFLIIPTGMRYHFLFQIFVPYLFFFSIYLNVLLLQLLVESILILWKFRQTLSCLKSAS